MILWRKSSYSQGNAQGDCVEVSTNIVATVFIRDSKDADGPRLVLTTLELAAFLGKIKTAR